MKRFLLYSDVFLLLVLSMGLAIFRYVPMKMLPFDNKDEFQIVIDMPEGTTLEQTSRVVQDFEQYLRQVPEVTNVISYAGMASPMDFNGMCGTITCAGVGMWRISALIWQANSGVNNKVMPSCSGCEMTSKRAWF